MRRVWIPRRGGPGVLELREEPDPRPTAGELRVRVSFSGVNFAEVMARLGLYPDAPPMPFVPGYEVAGRVDAVGPGVEEDWIGRRVTAVTRFGGYADTVCLSPALALATPDRLPDELAAALPVNFLTAHQMLHRVCAVREGETVLVHGAAGGVGTAALQLCRVAGARVIGLASPSKHGTVRDLGAEPVDARSRDWPAAVRELSGGRGVDIALDPVGGVSFRHSYELLAPGGRLCCFGVSAMAPGRRRSLRAALWTLFRMPRFGPVALMNDNRSVAGVNLGRLWDETEMLRPQLASVLRLAGEGGVTPVLDRTFSLEEAAAAHERLQSRANVGKVLLRA